MASPLHIHTPLVTAPTLSRTRKHEIIFKMDSLQPSGSFKIRGIGKLAQQMVSEGRTRFVSSSGGNAGMATAYAGQFLEIPTTVVVPSTTLPYTQAKIASYGATVVVHGSVWDEADAHAREICAKNSDAGYIPPFDHPTIWTGNSTVIDEAAADLAASGVVPSAVVVAVGGGGLLCGVAQGMEKAGWHDVPIIALETTGAASYHAAIAAGELVSLSEITSIARTLGARRVCSESFEWSKRRKIVSLVVEDREAVAACLSFAAEMRTLVEPACGAALAAVYDDKLYAAVKDSLHGNGPILVIACGGSGTSPQLLCDWTAKFNLA